MYNLKKLIVCMAGAAFALNLHAQQVQGFVHKQSEATDYVWPTDQQVLDKLDKWQDQKFGVLFHWGLYSVPGIVESWSICSEDVDWISRKKPLPYDEYKEWYWGLKDSLNPVNFNPEQWADVMQDAGIKYMIFTTKHHDGFCTYDSKYTDFSIAHGAFKDNPRKNVAYHVFDAFRKRGFMTGCYFSKPDWHCEWFWNPYFATPDRNINYKKDRHPDWWKNYQTFTRNQLNELMSDYGSFDILWLDGGWVKGDDIGLDDILAQARRKHPGLISVDRSIRVIEEEVAKRLHEVGEWLRANGKAIYNTRITPVYQDGHTWFTADKDGQTLYAIYALPEGETLPEVIEWTGNLPKGKMKMLKGNKSVKYTCDGDKVKVFLPKGIKNEPIALQFKVRAK